MHLGALSGDETTALYLQGTVVGSAAMRFRRQSGGDALRQVMAENMGPWLRALSTSRWKVGGDREKFADAWRHWVEEQFPVGGMLHLPQPPGVPPVRPAAPPAAVAKPVPKTAPTPPPEKSPSHQDGSYANIRYVLWHFGGELATEQCGSKVITSAPGLGWLELVAARGEAASTAGPTTSTPGTCWTTCCGIMGPTRLNGIRRWPCWPASRPEAERGLSHRPKQGPERPRCPREPVLRGGKGHRSRRHKVGRMGLRRRLLRGARGRVRWAVEPQGRPLRLLDQGRRRPHQAVTSGGSGRLASRPRRVRVVPLRPMTRI